MQAYAVENGADLPQMPSYELDAANDGSDKYDYVPFGGWASLAQTIFNNWCTPELHLS
jgi:hypothetical protein